MVFSYYLWRQPESPRSERLHGNIGLPLLLGNRRIVYEQESDLGWPVWIQLESPGSRT